MANIEALREMILPQMDKRSLAPANLAETLELICTTIASPIEDEWGEVEDYSEIYDDTEDAFQLAFTDKPESEWLWLKIDNGAFSWGKGLFTEQFSTTVLRLTTQVAADIIGGLVSIDNVGFETYFGNSHNGEVLPEAKEGASPYAYRTFGELCWDTIRSMFNISVLL